MSGTRGNEVNDSKKNTEKGPYEAPAIIYEGLITTRAGSSPGRDDDAVDPADIFTPEDA